MIAALLIGAVLSGADVRLARDCSVSNGVLVIDSSSETQEFAWRRYALDAAAGRFRRGARYEISFKARVASAGTGAKLLVLVRPEPDPSNGRSDAASIKVGPTEGAWRTVSILVDAVDRDDYRLQFHSWNRLRAEIADLKMRERAPLAFVPASQSCCRSPAVAADDPCGAQEFDVVLPDPSSEQMIDASAYGMSPTNDDNTVALRAALADAKNRQAKGLRIERGTYRFRADSPVRLEGLTDFTLDGGGSTFVTHRRHGVFMSVKSCRRIRLKDFNLDWDWSVDPLASLVRVVATTERSYDLAFVDYENFPRKDTMLMLLSAYDPVTRSVGFEGGLTRSIDFARPSGTPTRREWLSGNRLRVHRNPEGMVSGQLYRLQHYYYHLGGLILDSNVDMRLERLNVLSTPGHAFVVKGTQCRTVFDRVNVVVPENDARRVITCTADHLHVVGSRGFIKLEDCEFSRGADDCVNLHDCSGFARRIGPRTIRTENARSYVGLPSGTRIELRRADYAPSGFVGTVRTSTVVNPSRAVCDITFAENVPDDQGEGFVMFDRTYDTHNVIIRNCRFHDNRARGLLVLARDVTVEGCTFAHHEMGAVKIETGYTLDAWSEGYGVSNVVFRNNVFDNVNPSGSGRLHGQRSVYLGVYMRHDPSSDVTTYPILRDILFENNVFRNDSGVVAWVSSAANVAFRGNRIDESAPRRDVSEHRGRFYVTNARNVRFDRNRWEVSDQAPEPGVVWDPETCQNIQIESDAGGWFSWFLSWWK